MLDPRAVALQGVPYAPLLVAVQGLLPAGDQPVVSGLPPSGGFIVNVGRLMGR